MTWHRSLRKTSVFCTRTIVAKDLTQIRKFAYFRHVPEISAQYQGPNHKGSGGEWPLPVVPKLQSYFAGRCALSFLCSSPAFAFSSSLGSSMTCTFWPGPAT